MPYFTIELCSDLCVSDGENFGSVIDTDISYDIYGLPVINGKVLKGCLRKISEELEDIRLLQGGFTEKLFGSAGNQFSSPLTVQNAHPTNYGDMITDIQNHSDLCREKEIRECYTYTRGQTSIDKQKGTAQQGTLRNIRVLHRGYTFICEYTIREPEYEQGFLQCIKALRYIGLNRTRGLGEVKCRPFNIENNTVQSDSDNLCSFQENDFIEYTVQTLSGIVVSLQGKEDYLPASLISGICFRTLGEKTVTEMLDKGLCFTNAYISDGNKPFFSNPAFLAKQKEAVFDNGEMPVYVFDTEKCNKATPPALALKNRYVSILPDFSAMETMSVTKEIRCHHKQSQLNPGNVDTVNFYQLPSVSANQFFIGRIYASPDILQSIADALHQNPYHNIGRYKSGGYGKCRITVRKGIYLKPVPITTDTIAVWLQSPVILYDNYGMPCAKPSVFQEYFNILLGRYTNTSVKEIKNTYLNYTDIGGFNSIWGMNKPVIKSYDSGTVFVLTLTDKTDITILYHKLLGERTNEGYGMFTAFDYNAIVSVAEKELSVRQCETANAYSLYPSFPFQSWKLPSEIIRDKHNRYFTLNTATEYYQQHKSELNPSAIGRLTLMLKESNSYEQFIQTVDSIKDENKKAAIKKWIRLPEEIQKLGKPYDIQYLNFLFTLEKYRLRGEKS